VRACSIGPAGEQLVRFATIMNDGGRAVGRGGLGAVMGAKRLKAIAVAGGQAVDVADPEMLQEIRREMLQGLQESQGAQTLSAYGTGANLGYMLEIGNLPLQNWRGDQWTAEAVRALSSSQVPEESFKRTKAGCYGCPIGCEKVVRGPGGAGEESGPEYETVAAFGSLLLNDDWESIVRVNHLCNRYGMDTIEAGTTLAMATECFEQGLLTEAEAGFSLDWGDAENIVRAVESMARREGFGDVLARGVRGAAAEIGGEAPTFAMHVKGSSLCMHDPRIQPEMGLKYATLPMGAYHGKGCPMEASVVPEAMKVAQAVVERQNFSEVTDSLVMCSFAFAQFAGGASREYIPRFLQAVTGREWSMEALNQAGERIFTLKRAFIVPLGVTEADDTLPRRFERVPRVRFERAHTAAIVADALPEYYKLRGLQENGVPTAERLARLGIEPVSPRTP
jgi:aldehyde:ferredoxin oxidoreductase